MSAPHATPAEGIAIDGPVWAAEKSRAKHEELLEGLQDSTAKLREATRALAETEFTTDMQIAELRVKLAIQGAL